MAKLIRSCNIAKSVKPNLDEKYLMFTASNNQSLYRLDVATLTSQLYNPPGITNNMVYWTSSNPSMSKVFGSWANSLYYKSKGTWTHQKPGGIISKWWYAGGMSDDGEVRVVGAQTGRLYVYESGVWTEHQPEGNIDCRWWNAKVSGDGSVIIVSNLTAAGGTWHTWKYQNSVWSLLAPAGSTTFSAYGISITYDGTKYFVSGGNTSYLWNGSTWTAISNAYNAPYFMKRDGSMYSYIIYGFTPYTGYWLKYFDGTNLIQAPYAGFTYNFYDAHIKSDLSVGFFGRQAYNTLPSYGFYPFSAMTANFNPVALGSNYYYQFRMFNKFR